jgi:hypothetical protein
LAFEMSSAITRKGGAPTFETVVQAIAPLVGPNMARAAARGHCEKLGLNADQLTPAGVACLVDALAPGLSVFVGRERSNAALAPIRLALERSKGAVNE